MKRKLPHLLFVILTAVVITSCQPDTSSYGDLIVGRWKLVSENGAQTTKLEYWVYYNDGTGKTWDESDEDITEDDAQYFKWTLTEDNLIQMHGLEVNGTYPVVRDYTITVLNEQTMTYKDDFTTSSFTRL